MYFLTPVLGVVAAVEEGTKLFAVFVSYVYVVCRIVKRASQDHRPVRHYANRKYGMISFFPNFCSENLPSDIMIAKEIFSCWEIRKFILRRSVFC